MTRSRVRFAMALMLLVGCGSSEESTFDSSRCFSDDLGCGPAHCTTRDTCRDVSCKIEEGYDDDLDYFYKSKCTETVTTTTVATPLDGVGIRTTTVRESMTQCFYKEKVDDDDFEVTDQCTGSTETTVTRETCARDPSCPSCAPICTPLDTTVTSTPRQGLGDAPSAEETDPR